MRWNNSVLRDLRNCNLDGVWRILAEDRNEWRNQIWAATQEVHFKKEEQEKYRKNEQKCRRKARQTASEFALHCSSDGCGFTAVNHADLVNHQRQKHGQSLTSEYQYCHQKHAFLLSENIHSSDIAYGDLGLHCCSLE